MDRLRSFLNRNRKPITAHEEFDLKEIGKSASKDKSTDSSSMVGAHRIKEASKESSFFAKLKKIPPRIRKSLSNFKVSKALSRDKTTNSTIEPASKDKQQTTKQYLQKLGYSGKELKTIIDNLNNIPDAYYLDAVEDIPQKKFQILGYSSQRLAIHDFDHALAALMEANFSMEEAGIAILHAKDSADKDNFRKSFKEIIDSKVANATYNHDPLYKEEDEKKFMISWAMETLQDKNALNNKQEALAIAEDIYSTLLEEHHEKSYIKINSIFMEKIYEMVKPPDNEATEVKRIL